MNQIQPKHFNNKNTNPKLSPPIAPKPEKWKQKKHTRTKTKWTQKNQRINNRKVEQKPLKNYSRQTPTEEKSTQTPQLDETQRKIIHTLVPKSHNMTNKHTYLQIPEPPQLQKRMHLFAIDQNYLQPSSSPPPTQQIEQKILSKNLCISLRTPLLFSAKEKQRRKREKGKRRRERETY